MTLTVELTRDVEGFLADFAPGLEEREDENNFVLGLALRLARGTRDAGSESLMVGVRRDGDFAGAGIIPPGGLFAVSGLAPDAVAELAPRLAREGVKLSGAVGPRPSIEWFATRWEELASCTARIDMEKRLHRLDAVAGPPRPGGRLRRATSRDLELVQHWSLAFAKEAGVPNAEGSFARAREKVEEGAQYLWEERGQAVSIVSATRPTRRGCAVGAVYTPPELRGRGYASAAVTAISQCLLDEGFEYCTLFTDLANPTSNRIYARVGYLPLGDFRLYGFN